MSTFPFRHFARRTAVTRTMRSLLAVLGLTLCTTLGLSACNGAHKGSQPLPITQIRFVNDIADSPAITVALGNNSLGSFGFQQDSTLTSQISGISYKAHITYLDPTDLSAKTLVPDFSISAVKDHAITVILKGTMAAPTVEVIDNPKAIVDAGKAEIYVHNGSTKDSLAVYLTNKDVDLATATPITTLNAGATAGPLPYTVDANSRLRVTVSGSSTLLFDSAAFAVSALSRVMFVLDDSFGPAPNLLTADVLSDGATTAQPNVAAPSSLRVLDAAATETSVGADIVVTTGGALVRSDTLSFGTLTDLTTTAAATVHAVVTPQSAPTNVFTSPDIVLGADTFNTVVLLGSVAGNDRAAALLISDRRPVATRARVQFYNGSPTAGSVDFFVLKADTALAGSAAVATAQTLGASTSIDAQPGSYDLYLTATGTQTVVAGPTRVALGARTSFLFVALDAPGGGAPVTIKVRDDTSPLTAGAGPL